MSMSDRRYFYAVGRRKTATAKVQLHDGTGQIIVNGRPFEEVFTRLADQVAITEPFRVADATGRYSVMAKVGGGGVSGWAGALAHGIARALALTGEERRVALRHAGLLTRDARVKERKKYGLKRARKAPQYTKR